jgi:hypothetical protein
MLTMQIRTRSERRHIQRTTEQHNEEELLSLLSSQWVKKSWEKSYILQRRTKKYYDHPPHGHSLLQHKNSPTRSSHHPRNVHIVKKSSIKTILVPVGTILCTSPPKCPTWLRKNHKLGTSACPIFAARRQKIKKLHM